MDSEDRQDERTAVTHRGGWYLIKGIPVAVIITLAVTIIPQTVTVAWFLANLARDGEVMKEKQIEHGVKLDKTDAKLDALTNVVQGGTVPNALNAARITSLEQKVDRIDARVTENERKLATESMRNRASRER